MCGTLMCAVFHITLLLDVLQVGRGCMMWIAHPHTRPFPARVSEAVVLIFELQPEHEKAMK